MTNLPRHTRVNLVFIAWICANLVRACRQRYTREAVVGYQCEGEDISFRNSSSITSGKCIRQCMKRTNCVQINYDNMGNHCLLFSGFSTLAEPDPKFIMLRFVDHVVPRDECIRWIPFMGNFPSDGVIINAPVGYFKHLLARGTVNSEVIPGKIYAHNLELWSVYNGQAGRITKNIEYLYIHPSCFGVWLPYISGLGVDLPAGAVQGDMLASGTPLYVAKVSNTINLGTSFGYYEPDVDLAIITDLGKVTSTEMSILVLIWSRCIISQTVYMKCHTPLDNFTWLLTIHLPTEYKIICIHRQQYFHWHQGKHSIHCSFFNCSTIDTFKRHGLLHDAEGIPGVMETVSKNDINRWICVC